MSTQLLKTADAPSCDPRPTQVRERRMPALQQTISSTEDVQSLNAADQKAVAIAALQRMSEPDRVAVAQRTGLGPPGRHVTNTIWLVVIVTFCIVLLSSFATLAYTVIRSINGASLLTVFTTVTAFLAGLLSPSPAGGAGQNGS
jgi:hypothetical protein